MKAKQVSKDIQQMIDSIGDNMANAIFERMQNTLQMKMTDKEDETKVEDTTDIKADKVADEPAAEPVNNLGNAVNVVVPELLDVVSGKYMMFAGYVSKHRTFATFLFDEQNKAIKILKNSEIPVDCNVKNLDGCGVVQYIKIRDISTLTVCSRYKCVASKDRYDLCKLIIENGGIPGIKDSTAKNGVRVNTDAAPVYRLNQDSEWIDYLYALQILYGDNAMSYANWYNVLTGEAIGTYLTRKDLRISKDNGRGGEIVELKTKDGEGLEYKLKDGGSVSDGYQYVPDEDAKKMFRAWGIPEHLPAPRHKPRKKANKTA